jgi:hypothetical protein
MEKQLTTREKKKIAALDLMRVLLVTAVAAVAIVHLLQ